MFNFFLQIQGWETYLYAPVAKIKVFPENKGIGLDKKTDTHIGYSTKKLNFDFLMSWYDFGGQTPLKTQFQFGTSGIFYLYINTNYCTSGLLQQLC